MIGTKDDVTLAEDLLEIKNNREINPHHDLNAKEKCSEARKQDKQPARETEGDNTVIKTHQRNPPKSGLNIPTSEPAQHLSSTGHQPTLRQTNNSILMLNASANEWKKTLLMLSLPSTKSKSLASNVSFNAAKGQHLHT